MAHLSLTVVVAVYIWTMLHSTIVVFVVVVVVVHLMDPFKPLANMEICSW